MIMSYEITDLVKVLTDIKDHLNDFDNSKLFQECKYLGRNIGKYFMSATIVYRLRKLSQLSELSLPKNVEYLKMEINDLISILTNLVFWQCKTCNKTIQAEHEEKLELWIKAHKMSNNHK